MPQMTAVWYNLTVIRLMRLLPTVLIALPILTTAAEIPSSSETITTIAQLRRYSGCRTPEIVMPPIIATGQVISVSRQAKSCSPSLVLKDETGVFEFFCTSNTTVACGDLIELKGTYVFPSHYQEPLARALIIKRLGHCKLPSPPTVKLAALEQNDYELQVVKTQATVVDVFVDELGPAYDFWLLKDGPTILPAFCPHNPEHQKLVDARVEVSGLVRRGISSERKFVGTCIALSGLEDISVLEPAPADPFDYPALPHTTYTTPQDIAKLGKRTVKGTVIAVWQQVHLLVKTDDEQLIIIEQSDNRHHPAYGDRITAAGYPATDLFRMNLTRAHVHIDASNCLDESTPAPSNTDELPILKAREGLFFSNQNFGKLVTVRGIARALPLPQKGDFQLLLDCDGIKVPVDFSANPTAAGAVRLGCTVEATGRCILNTAPWRPTDVFPRISGMTLVVRKPDDIRIVSWPPWWTPMRLTVVIALLLVLLLVFYIRNQFLKRLSRIKLNERTQLAVELHDSLSQSLTGLACQITAAEDAFDSNPSTSKDCLRTAGQMLMTCREGLRNCLFDLRNDTYDEKDFNKAIWRTIESFDDNATILIRFRVDRTRFDDATVHAVLAIIRELVSNAVRHGNAWTIKIAGVIDNDTLLFSVTDDGSGFDPAHRKGSDEGHFGLDGVRERLARFDGELTIGSSKTGGTRIVVRIPLPQT